MFTEAADRLSAEIIRIAKATALQDCEAVECGQSRCPKQYTEEADFCLPYAARSALDLWMNA
jgi:hypothetical protein